MKTLKKITKAPFLRNNGSVYSFMADMLIIMPFIYTMPFFLYGFRVIKNLIFSLAAAYLCDILCLRIRDGKFSFNDLSSLITGAIIPLLLPASVEFYIILIADVFAICIAKHPFGGLGNNPFNPAAAAYCFVAVSFSDKVFRFTKPMQWIKIFGSVTDESLFTKSMAQTLKNNGKPLDSIFDILSGNHAGQIGTTCIIILVACGIYLFYKKTINLETPLGVFASVAILAFLFPRIITGRFESVFYELTSGMLVFGALFMATEPSSSPKHPYAKFIYGILIGILTMLFRFYGKTEIAFPFALIIANSLTPFLDKIGTGIDNYTDITIGNSQKLKKVKGGDKK